MPQYARLSPGSLALFSASFMKEIDKVQSNSISDVFVLIPFPGGVEREKRSGLLLASPVTAAGLAQKLQNPR